MSKNRPGGRLYLGVSGGSRKEERGMPKYRVRSAEFLGVTPTSGD